MNGIEIAQLSDFYSKGSNLGGMTSSLARVKPKTLNMVGVVFLLGTKHSWFREAKCWGALKPKGEFNGSNYNFEPCPWPLAGTILLVCM